MTRLLGSIAIAIALALIGAESAIACSCAPASGPETLRGYDAAVTARLIEVVDDPPPESGGSDGGATWRYRITRVWKGEKRHNLREGELLELRWSRLISCDYPTQEGVRYGLRLSKSRRGFVANWCSGFDPRSLRKAAKRSGRARTASGADCSA
ncbi:hypothetical protein BH24ACT23_BH24ACT23_05790 [soil metagenome]